MVNFHHTKTLPGIDRIDSKKGYVMSNCVSCCTTCNSMKLDLTFKDFFEHIELVNNRKKETLELLESLPELEDGCLAVPANSDFDEFIQEIRDEAGREGPEAVAQLKAFEEYFADEAAMIEMDRASDEVEKQMQEAFQEEKENYKYARDDDES